jgi:hypothetical protein
VLKSTEVPSVQESVAVHPLSTTVQPEPSSTVAKVPSSHEMRTPPVTGETVQLDPSAQSSPSLKVTSVPSSQVKVYEPSSLSTTVQDSVIPLQPHSASAITIGDTEHEMRFIFSLLYVHDVSTCILPCPASMNLPSFDP